MSEEDDHRYRFLYKEGAHTGSYGKFLAYLVKLGANIYENEILPLEQGQRRRPMEQERRDAGIK